MESFTKTVYGEMPDGTPVHQFVLTNKNGMQLKAIEYGGIITHLTAPDKQNNFIDVVLGHDSLEEYLQSDFYFGALIGRYGNRIANAAFELDGTTYELAANNGPNNLHGGPDGFDSAVWNGERAESEDGVALILSYTSKDGEMGFPGTLSVEVIYNLTNDNALEILYRATSDKKTVVNLTQHSYFNLAGKGDILDHYLEINAEQFLAVDEFSIPVDDCFTEVEGTPFNFTMPKRVGADIETEDEQLSLASGYDHTFVIPQDESGLAFVASVFEADSGRIMKVFSSEPGVQFYSGNFIEEGTSGKEGHTYGKHSGLCLETQHYPDSPNRPDFPSVVLEAGNEYRSVTVYEFGAIEGI